MDHVAIMKKSWGLLPKILSGEKTIESRWYKNKVRPWGMINAGDMVYFKNSGEPFGVMAVVKQVKNWDSLDPLKVRQILEEYGEEDGIRHEELEKYYALFKEKKYCLLIFLEKPQKIKPFEINKEGFGAMAAWLCVPKIDLLQRQLG